MSSSDIPLFFLVTALLFPFSGSARPTEPINHDRVSDFTNNLLKALYAHDERHILSLVSPEFRATITNDEIHMFAKGYFWWIENPAVTIRPQTTAESSIFGSLNPQLLTQDIVTCEIQSERRRLFLPLAYNRTCDKLMIQNPVSWMYFCDASRIDLEREDPKYADKIFKQGHHDDFVPYLSSTTLRSFLAEFVNAFGMNSDNHTCLQKLTLPAHVTNIPQNLEREIRTSIRKCQHIGDFSISAQFLADYSRQHLVERNPELAECQHEILWLFVTLDYEPVPIIVYQGFAVLRNENVALIFPKYERGFYFETGCSDVDQIMCGLQQADVKELKANLVQRFSDYYLDKSVPLFKCLQNKSPVHAENSGKK